MFENSKYRTYVKDNFKSYLTEKGVEISDEEYTKIIKYIKKYWSTNINAPMAISNIYYIQCRYK